MSQASLFDELRESGERLGVLREGAGLCPADREVLATWAEHGIPADLSTVEAACEILMKLWALHIASEAMYRDVLDMVGAPGVAVHYETPATWTSGEGEHRRTVPATLTLSRVNDGWAASLTTEGWATLWLSSRPAEPWGLWRTMVAPKNDQVYPTATAAAAAAFATEQVGAVDG